jgi:NAD(P)-dependent dehydrogenase (short-subunit alcohol dehydrogenase family)
MPTPRKTALITGANKGIGFEVARSLATQGLTVLLGARNAALGEAAAAKLRANNLDVRFVPLDLDRNETFASAAALIASDYGHLDILVNNAAIVDRADGPPSTASIPALERVFHTNFFQTVALTQVILPLLRKAPSARVVNVSSGLGSLTLNADPNSPYASVKILGYNASKAALNMFTVQLAWELRDTAVKVNAADPGYTATDLNNHSGHQTIEQGAAETIRLALLPDDGPTGTFSDSNGLEAW